MKAIELIFKKWRFLKQIKKAHIVLEVEVYFLFVFIVKAYLLLIFILPYPVYSQNDRRSVLYDQFNRPIESSSQNRSSEEYRPTRPQRPEGMIINGRFAGPGDPEYERIQQQIRSVLEKENSLPGYQYMGTQRGKELFKDEKTGIVFLDTEGDTVLMRGGNKPDLPIYEDGQIKMIDVTDPRYKEIERARRDLVEQRAIQADASRLREQRITQRNSNRQTGFRNLLKNIKKRFGKIVGILASLGIASEVVEGSTSLNEVPARFADESTFSHPVTDSDTVKYHIDDMLEDLKTNIQKLDPETIFSQERQRLNNELRSLYTDVQTDTALQDEEKARYLRTIAEMQDFAQPPLRNFPQYRRDRRSRSEGTQ